MEVIVKNKLVSRKVGFKNVKIYQNPGDVERLIKYVMDENKRKELDIYGCINLIETEPHEMAMEMEKVKEIFDKQESYQIKHLCVDVGKTPFEKLKKQRFIYLFERALGYFRGVQIVYALHENTDILHIHLILNTVDIYGARLDLSDNKINGFKENFKKIFEKYYGNETVLMLLFY